MEPITATESAREPLARDVPPVTRTGPVSALPRWAFRAVITLHALAAFAQALLAGRFLSGDYEMLRAHFVNSQVVGALAIAQVVVAFLYWRPGGGPVWPVFASLGLLAVEPLQIAAGIKRVIGIHVPLGVAIITACVLFTVWAWRPGFGRRRPAKRRSAR